MPKIPRNADRPIPRGYGYVVPRSGHWQARWPVTGPDGRRRYESETFGTEDAAYDHLLAIGRKRRDGQYIEPRDRTVAQLVEDWLRRGRHKWQPATHATYRHLADTHVLPALGSLRAHAVTTPRLQHWIDGLVDAGRLAPATISNIRLVVTGAFGHAAKLGILPRNPAIGLELPARRRSTIATWSGADIQRVYHAVASDPFWSALYRTALSTGMRPGELRALTWADVDMGRGLVTVRRSMTRDLDYRPVVGQETKTGRARGVTLTDDTRAALARWRLEQKRRRLAAPQWEDTDLIFTRADGRFLPQTTWQRYHAELMTRASVPRITLHGLRHTVATLLLERNVHPKIVSDLLGHSSVQMTLDRYSHVSVDIQRAAAQGLEDAISGDAEAATT